MQDKLSILQIHLRVFKTFCFALFKLDVECGLCLLDPVLSFFPRTGRFDPVHLACSQMFLCIGVYGRDRYHYSTIAVVSRTMPLFDVSPRSPPVSEVHLSASHPDELSISKDTT